MNTMNKSELLAMVQAQEREYQAQLLPIITLSDVASDLVLTNPETAGAIMLRVLRGNSWASAIHAAKRKDNNEFSDFDLRGKHHNKRMRLVTDTQLNTLRDNRRTTTIFPDDMDMIIESLPIRCQLIASLTLDGYSRVDIADKTGISAPTISRDFQTIREKFSELLKQ